MSAGFVISVQYLATLISRPWTGRLSDRAGGKVAVEWGLGIIAVSGGVLWVAALVAPGDRALGFWLLILSRLALGAGESLTSTGSTLWSISVHGPKHTAKVISFNGISTYGGMALGAPLGVLLNQHGGLASIGIFVLLLCLSTMVLAARKSPILVLAGEQMPFGAVLERVVPHGMVLAFAGTGFSVLATFITLFYLSRHWDGAALCLTVFGCTYVATRLLFIQTINRFGGFRVAKVSLTIEFIGVLLLWMAGSPLAAMLGSALTGIGFALIFPAIGVEAVKRVPEQNRGAALGVYTAFADVSFFLIGPLAGAVIGAYGYRNVFLLPLICVVLSLAITFALSRRSRQSIPKF